MLNCEPLLRRVTLMKMSDIHSEIQMGILNYLSAHPDASASAQRIQANWLANERCDHSIDQVQTAIDRMVDRGELSKRPGSNLYSR